MAQRASSALGGQQDPRRRGIPYRVPLCDEDPPDRRRRGVLRVVYLIFNEGYTARAGAELVRDDLCADAIRLGRALVELMPDEPEAAGLLALMLLIQSRRAARTTAAGGLVRLADQDRELWDAPLIAEGQAIVRRCLARRQPGPYQIQAAMNAVHSDAATAAQTDWSQILALYDQLMAVAPTRVVALNRTVAVAEVHGPGAALAELDLDDHHLEGYHLYHAIRADLLTRTGDAEGAAAAGGRRASRSPTTRGRAGGPAAPGLRPIEARADAVAARRPWPRRARTSARAMTSSTLSPGLPTAIPAEHVQLSDTLRRRRSVTSVARSGVAGRAAADRTPRRPGGPAGRRCATGRATRRRWP